MDMTARRARRAVAVGFAIQGFTFASLLTRLTAVKATYALDDVDILLMVLAVSGVAGVGSALAGQAATRWGSAVVLRCALAIASLAVVLPGLAGGLTSLIPLAACYGFFLGAIDAAMNMQGVAVQERYGRSIMASFHGIWSLGAAAGAGLAALAADLGWSLLTGLVAAATVGLVANLVGCGGMLDAEADPLESGANSDAPVPFLPVLLVTVPTFVMWLNDGATSTWSGIYLEDALSATAAIAPLAYGAYQVCFFLVRLVGDRFVQAYGAALVVRVCGGVATLGGVLVIAAPGPWVAVVGFALLGLGLSLIPPLSMVAAAHAAPGAGDRAVARVNIANYAGFIVSAVVIAGVSELISPRAMFVIPVLCLPYLMVAARRFATTP